MFSLAASGLSYNQSKKESDDRSLFLIGYCLCNRNPPASTDTKTTGFRKKAACVFPLSADRKNGCAYKQPKPCSVKIFPLFSQHFSGNILTVYANYGLILSASKFSKTKLQPFPYRLEWRDVPCKLVRNSENFASSAI